MDFVKSTPGAIPIIVECFLNAAPDTVFKAWTDPDIVIQWFGIEPNSMHSAFIDLRVGGEWRFIRKTTDDKSMTFKGRYLDIVDGEFLKFTWSISTESSDGQYEESASSEVQVSFLPNGDGTDVRLQHSALEDTDSSKNFAFGWNASIHNIGIMLNAKFSQSQQ